MKAKELIEALNKFPPNKEVYFIGENEKEILVEKTKSIDKFEPKYGFHINIILLSGSND